jgi:hypothetical protein
MDELRFPPAAIDGCPRAIFVQNILNNLYGI